MRTWLQDLDCPCRPRLLNQFDLLPPLPPACAALPPCTLPWNDAWPAGPSTATLPLGVATVATGRTTAAAGGTAAAAAAAAAAATAAVAAPSGAAAAGEGATVATAGAGFCGGTSSGKRSHVGACHRFTLPATLTDQLHQLSRQHNVTLFMTLLTGFNVLLARYTGQTDLCVGTPIANRNRADIEGRIGFFVNTLVMRTDLSGNPTVADLLARVRETALGAYAHQDQPFEHLVEALAPVRNTGHTPLFQVMFALQNAPSGELQLSGLTLEQAWPSRMNSPFLDFDAARVIRPLIPTHSAVPE